MPHKIILKQEEMEKALHKIEEARQRCLSMDSTPHIMRAIKGNISQAANIVTELQHPVHHVEHHGHIVYDSIEVEEHEIHQILDHIAKALADLSKLDSDYQHRFELISLALIEVKRILKNCIDKSNDHDGSHESAHGGSHGGSHVGAHLGHQGGTHGGHGHHGHGGHAGAPAGHHGGHDSGHSGSHGDHSHHHDDHSGHGGHGHGHN